MKKITKCPVCNSNLIAGFPKDSAGLKQRNNGRCINCIFRCDTIIYHDGIIYSYNETLGLDAVDSLFVMDNYLYIPDRLVDG